MACALRLYSLGPWALAALGVALLAGSARAGDSSDDDPGGARAGFEAGALLGTTLYVSEVEGNRYALGRVSGEPGWIVGAQVEWALGRTVFVGGELWLTLLDVRTTDGMATASEPYAALAPRLRLALPIAGGLAVDAQVALGGAWLAGPLGSGGLGFTTRLGLGLAHPISEGLAGCVGLSFLAAAIVPVEALDPDAVLFLDEPVLEGVRTLMLTVGVRARR